MRENIAQQPPLVASAIDHVHAMELARVGELLRGLRGAATRVGDDLRRGVAQPHLGRRGLSGEQVLRIVVLKQLTGFSYERLAFHLADSMTYRSFCGLGLCGWAPKASTLQANVKPHTDLVRKGGREPQYGHKVFVSTGRSGLVLDVTVERGNPPDSKRAVTAVKRHKRVFGAVPQEVSYDAGFASRANQSELRAMGVREVAFAKNSAVDVMASVSSPAVHRALFRLRAGIEASISWLKRCFGLRRCYWSGFASFRAYALGSVLAANLLQLARLTM